MPNISQNLLFRILDYSDYKSYSLERLIKESKLTIEFHGNDTCYISMDSLGKLWEKAIEVSNKPILGYELHHVVNICEYGLLGRMVKYGPTVGDSIDAASKFLVLVNNDTHLSIISTKSKSVIKLSFSNSLLNQYPVMAKQKSLLALGLLLKSMACLADRDIKVDKIVLPRNLDKVTDLREKAFEIVYHDSSEIIVYINSEILAYKNIYGNQEHFNLFVTMASDLVNKNFSLEDKITKFYLTEDLTKFPGIEDVANYLDTSPRSIQRALSEKNLTFQEIQINAKMKRALGYLQNQMSVKDTALLVGYAESSSFSKAFKKYYGYSPVKVKQDQGGEKLGSDQ